MKMRTEIRETQEMKHVGSNIYCHWTDTADHLPMMDFEMACEVVDLDVGFKNPSTWDYVKWNKRDKTFTFTWCDDFDGKNEPVVVRQILVDPAERTFKDLVVSKDNPPIIHGKHLFVRDDYAGFDVDEARRRWNSYQGADWLDKSRMGFLKWWRENAYPRIGK